MKAIGKQVLCCVGLLLVLLLISGCTEESAQKPETEENALGIFSEERESWTAAPHSYELGALLELCPSGSEYLLATESGIVRLDHALALTETEPVEEVPAAMTVSGETTLMVLYHEPGYEVAAAGETRFPLGELHRHHGQLYARGESVWFCNGFELVRDGKALELPKSPEGQWYAAALAEGEDGLFVLLRLAGPGEGETLDARLVPLDQSTDTLSVQGGASVPELLWNASPICAPDSGCVYADGKVWRLEQDGIHLLAELSLYGVNPSRLRRVLVTDENHILCLEEDCLTVLSPLTKKATEGENESISPSTATQIPPAERKTLQIGSVYGDGFLNSFVSYVNRHGTGCKLQVKVCESVEELNLGLLNNEFDLIALNDLSVLQNYAKKGLLQPLEELLPELFSSGRLYPNMVKGLSLDGHCYYVPELIYPLACLLPKSYELAPEDLDSLAALVEMREEREAWSFGLVTKDSALGAHWLPMTLGHWVDPDAGTAAFDTQEFVALLEFCNRFPETWEEVLANTGQHGEEPRFRTGIGFGIGTLLEDEIYTLPFSGLHPVYLHGMPYFAAVRQGSVEDAGTILETLLNDEGWLQAYQREHPYEDVVIFLNQSWTEARLDKRLQISLEHPGDYSKAEIQAAVESIRTGLSEADYFVGNESQLIHVIQEEAAAYFNGDCTAEEAARRIQNRVEIYLAERG